MAEESLQGGIISQTRRLRTASGFSFVLKTSTEVPPDVYPLEAEGLRTLDLPDCPRVPKVLQVAADHLMLEDLGSNAPGPNWQAEFARQLANLHKQTAPQFGFDHDNYLGRLPQINAWSDDGPAFYVEHRVLRYLHEPRAEAVMTAEDRRGVERLCRRFLQITPKMPPALIHGDLWCANWLTGPNGEPAYLDPAVYYGLAESELSFTRMFGGLDVSFYDQYVKHHPLPEGWRERLPYYDAREWAAMAAHYGNIEHCVDRLREQIAALS
ncbi:MAG: fructosamine kinase family protein [Tepidisphaeraceae bacterium]